MVRAISDKFLLLSVYIYQYEYSQGIQVKVSMTRTAEATVSLQILYIYWVQKGLRVVGITHTTTFLSVHRYVA